MIMIAAASRCCADARTSTAPTATSALPVVKIVLEGVVVGLVTGLVGAGGGFLVVPALALLGGLPMPVAVGTSLVVIAMKSFAGLRRTPGQRADRLAPGGLRHRRRASSAA